jgi:predicted AAA+ superfamily ATPase
MQSLISISDRLTQVVNCDFARYLYDNIAWNNRLIGIVGAKGTGKTTLMLQYIKQNFSNSDKALYASLDNIWFAQHSLLELAGTFHSYGGTHLFLDEVHRYADWAREIKNIYDSYPALHIVFTGSSMLEIFQASVDLSRRVISYELKGLSFREFLKFDGKIDLPVFPLDEILKNHRTIANNIVAQIKILPPFKNYLEYGYYPYYQEDMQTYPVRVAKSINKTFDEDLPAIEPVEYATIVKLKKLLAVIAEMVPFQPNIASLSGNVELNRNILVKYLYLLDKAGLINCISDEKLSLEKLSKPDKIYLENTNIISALAVGNANTGNVRETFFANQLRTKHTVNTAVTGDFTIDRKFVFEIGGRNKSNAQIKNIENSYIAADEMETGFANKIPLWLFGFLY